MHTRPDVVVRAALVALVMAAVPASGFGQGAPVSAQPQPAPAQPAPAQPVAAQPVPPAPTPAGQGAAVTPASQAGPIQEQKGGGPTRRLTIEEAVQVALEQNLDVQVERINPKLAEKDVDVARGVWLPQLTSSMQFRNSDSVPNSILSGAEDTLTSRSFSGTGGYEQLFPTGTSLNVGFDAARQTSNGSFSSFNPELNSSLSFDLVQPLLRGFKIDVNRAQFRISKKNQEITDVQLRQQIVATTRSVRLAYWTLVGARYNLGVAQASLDISRQTLRDNRTRVEVGTMAPIDVVGAEAEVARNEESAIIAAAQIDEAEDTLRALIYDPKAPDFWTMDLDLADAPQLPTSKVDVDVESVVRVALEKRTDLIQVRKQLEISQINLDLAKDNTKPQVNAVVSYGLAAVGGVQVTERGPGDPNNPFDPGPIISTTERRFGSVLGDLFGLDFPTWVLGVQVRYPLGNSTQKANAARQRLAYRAVAALPAQPGAGRGQRSPDGGAQRQHQPQARRIDDVGAGLLGAAARRRPQEIRRRPGAEHRRPDRPARPGQCPLQRAEFDHRLREVARRARDGAGRRHRRRRPRRGRAVSRARPRRSAAAGR